MNKVLLLAILFFLTLNSFAQTIDNRIPSVNGQVSSIQRSGDTVYIGGSFATVGSLPRTNLAAFSASTGQILNWAPNPNNFAEVVGISNGKVVVQGSFDTIAGQHRF